MPESCSSRQPCTAQTPANKGISAEQCCAETRQCSRPPHLFVQTHPPESSQNPERSREDGLKKLHIRNGDCHTPQNITPYWSYQTTSNSSLNRPIDIPLAQLFITFHIIPRLFPSQSADICMSSPHLFGCCTRSINDKSWGLSPSRRHLMR